jgi:hypothetical protein
MERTDMLKQPSAEYRGFRTLELVRRRDLP